MYICHIFWTSLFLYPLNNYITMYVHLYFVSYFVKLGLNESYWRQKIPKTFASRHPIWSRAVLVSSGTWTTMVRKVTPNIFRTRSSILVGIISYTEYLFLLSILTSKYPPVCSRNISDWLWWNLGPQSGFRIAFNMFDTDGNEKIDITEFLVVSTALFMSRS